ncbi:toll-like receptor 6 [Saccostrea echinata]|uniref:toll-like receptor 6 n=1 Tax=Saccostrea echinata TaxID=191078 RepID=UPI002A8157CA|nr:toll-like receptor 6 [Saccostrea echinata]
MSFVTIVSSIKATGTGSDELEVKSKANYCNISECHLRIEEISTSRLRNRLDSPLQLSGKRVTIDNKNNCTINSTLLRENLDMKIDLSIGLISVKCSNNISIHFSSDGTLFHTDMFLHLQVLTCSISMDSLFVLNRNFGNIYSLELDRTPLPSDQTSCNFSYLTKDVCKTWESVHSIKLSASTSESPQNNISRVFNCPGNLTAVRELILRNWQIDAHGASFLKEKFPFLQNLEISFSMMTIPPQFPWDETNRTFPHNFSESAYTIFHYLHSYHVVLTRQFYKRTINLNSNSITDLSDFRFFGYIQLLDLSYNKLQVLNERSFNGLQGVQHLNLRNNKLKTISSQSWRSLKLLRHLNLHSNDITEIQPDMFDNNPEIEYLDLSNNNINRIEEYSFTNLFKLKEIRLESNAIVNLPSNFLPSNSLNFQYLYLDQNPLIDFPLSIVYFRSLEKVSLRHTNVDLHEFKDNELLLTINYYALRTSVAKWSEENINGNKEKSPERLRQIDLSGSRVENIELDVFKSGRDTNKFKHLIWRLSVILKHFEFVLDGISLQCNCRINQFNRFVQEAINRNLFSGREYFFNDWKCSFPLEFKDKPLVSIKESNTYCVTITPHCPRNCTCLKRSVSGIIIVDCRQRGYFSLPEQLPDGILDIWFQYNNISVIRNIGYLNRIRQLYLSQNQIVEIENDAIESMHNIRHLHVDSNNLVVMPTKIQERDMEYINIDNNPFKCDCNAIWMKHWLLSNSESFSDVTGITCNIDDQNEKGTKFVNIPDSDFICLDEYNTLKDLIIPISVSTLSIILIIIGICFIHLFSFEVKVLMFMYFGIHPFDLDEDEAREAVDVLVVHAPGLTNWVMENIVGPLEAQKAQYIVCEIMRDFIPGYSIQDNFESIVKNSKRMILVLSPEILADQLLKLVWSEAQEKIKELRSNYVVMVYYNLNANDIMNEDMLRYINHSKTMTSNDRLLRQKLLYCMPVIYENTDEEDQRLEIRHCVKKMYGDEIGKQVLFERHVFISYSNAEIRCLLDEIKPLLEDKGYTLCLPDRDFIPGAPQEENILKAIDTCLHTIFILSGNHLQDEWSIFTFRTAWEKSLRNKSNYLIVILSEDVELDDMDDEIKYHVKTHVTLRIGDEWFATKLLNSLVDVNTYARCVVDGNNREDLCCLDYDEQSISDSMLFDNHCDIAARDSRIENVEHGIQIEEEKRWRRVVSVDIHKEFEVENMQGIEYNDNEDFINDYENEAVEYNATESNCNGRENSLCEVQEKCECRSIIEHSDGDEFEDLRFLHFNNNTEGEISFNIKEVFHLNVTEDEENLSDIKNENVCSSFSSVRDFDQSRNFRRLNIHLETDEGNIHVTPLFNQLKTDYDVSDCDVSDSDNNTDSESSN